MDMNKKEQILDILQGDLEDERVIKILDIFGFDKDGFLPKGVEKVLRRLSELP